MVLLLGLCRALKALHQYRVGETGGVGAAKQVRAEATEADQDAIDEVEETENPGRNRRRDKMRANGDIEHEPLMDDEVTMSQEGVESGEIRAYAHRDIKPGIHASNRSDGTVLPLGSLAN